MSKCLVKPVQLEPCPYCRSLDVEVSRPGMLLYSVQCLGCKAQGPHEYRKADAVDMWNTRNRRMAA